MATVGLRLGPADHGRPMTLEEFRAADAEGGYRYELARGVVQVVEVPDDLHGQVMGNFQEMLYHYKRSHPGVIRRIGGGGEFRLWVDRWFPGETPMWPWS